MRSPCSRAAPPLADAAATLVANAVDVPITPASAAEPARALDEDSDLGNLPVTVAVPALDAEAIEGRARRRRPQGEGALQARGVIEGAALTAAGALARARRDRIVHAGAPAVAPEHGTGAAYASVTVSHRRTGLANRVIRHVRGSSPSRMVVPCICRTGVQKHRSLDGRGRHSVIKAWCEGRFGHRSMPSDGTQRTGDSESRHGQGPEMSHRLAGVDVGGTFTDLLFMDETAGEVRLAKVPTTADNQAFGVLAKRWSRPGSILRLLWTCWCTAPPPPPTRCWNASSRPPA